MNSVIIVNKPEEELIDQDVPIERVQEKNEEFFDELIEEAKAIAVAWVPSLVFEESTNIQEWNLEKLGPENEGSKHIAPLLLALERVEESITWGIN